MPCGRRRCPRPCWPNLATSPAALDAEPVPAGMRVAAAWAWRLLVLAGLGYVLLFILGRLSEVVIPVAIALLLSALLSPPLRLLVAWGWHRTLATVTVFLVGLGVVIGLIWVVVAQFIDGYSRAVRRRPATESRRSSSG